MGEKPIRTWDQIFADLERLTAPQGNWSLEWNDQRSSYETVEESRHDDIWNFESEAEASRARQENRVVGLHWYKDTPVGSYKVAAPDMAALRRVVSALIDEVAAVPPANSA